MKLIIYIFSLLVAYLVIHLAYPLKNNLDLLSTGALLSTFGAALITLADIFERDKLERVKLNIHICYNDILKSKEWVRWPFIKRRIVKPSATATP